MSTSRYLLVSIALVALSRMLAPAWAEGGADADAAKAQFMKSCGVCHTTESKAELRQGPNLAGVVGRKAGTLAEFPTYSDALKKAGAGGLVWTDETLDKWMAGAADFVPGSNMFYSQPDPDKRKLIIAYLKNVPAGTGGVDGK